MAGEAIITIRDREWVVVLTNMPWELKGRRGVQDPPWGIGMLLDTGWEQMIQVVTLPTLYCLDVAFLSETMVVVEVYRNVPACSEVSSTLPARYFLEVCSGDLDDIDTGDRAWLEILPS